MVEVARDPSWRSSCPSPILKQDVERISRKLSQNAIHCFNTLHGYCLSGQFYRDFF